MKAKSVKPYIENFLFQGITALFPKNKLTKNIGEVKYGSKMFYKDMLMRHVLCVSFGNFEVGTHYIESFGLT